MEKEKALIVSLMYVSLLIPSAYAQTEVEDFIEEGIESMIDDFTKDLDFSEQNMLNATQEETEELKEAGLEMIDIGIELIKTSHHFSTALINWLSPYTIPDLIVSIIAGVIAFIITLSVLKRIAFHIMLLTVIILLIVGLLVYFYY